MNILALCVFLLSAQKQQHKEFQLILAAYSGDNVISTSPVGISVAHVHYMHMHIVHLIF